MAAKAAAPPRRPSVLSPRQVQQLKLAAARGDPTARGILAHMSMQAGAIAGAANPFSDDVNIKRSSNLRFRSFAERYLVTRSQWFRQDPEGLAEDTWNCVLDAKRVYKLIGEVGVNVQDD